MSKSPSLRRIQADIRELALDPSDRYYASPLEHDMFEWHFTIRGADDTDFHGGIYHGRILVRTLNLFTTKLVRCFNDDVPRLPPLTESMC